MAVCRRIYAPLIPTALVGGEGVVALESQASNLRKERSAIVDCLDRLWSDLGVAVVPCVCPDSHESLHAIGVVILPPLDIVHHHARRIPRDLAEHRRYHLNTQRTSERPVKNSGKTANPVKNSGHTVKQRMMNMLNRTAPVSKST